jgi:gliding motility-associated-like protein
MEKLLLRNRTFTNAAGKTTRKTLTSVYRFAFSALLTLGLFFGAAQNSMAQTPVLHYAASNTSYTLAVDQPYTGQTFQSPAATNVSAPSYAAQTAFYTGGSTFAPTAVNVDVSGNVYFIDQGSGQLDMIPSGQTTPTAIATGLSSTGAIAFDATGNLYYTTPTAVYKITKPGQSGTATTALITTGLTNAAGIALDAAGNIYVSDANSGVHAVFKYLVSNSFAGSTLISSGFTTPVGLTVDAAGNIYVADSATGKISEIPVSITSYPVASGSFTAVTTVGQPNSLIIDNTGNLLVADQTTKSIIRIDPSGNKTTINTSALSSPQSAGIDAQGNIYFTDNSANTVYESKMNGGYYISPALPLGLTFSAVTGGVSGTPVGVMTAVKAYNVTAYNSTSNTSTTGVLRISIEDTHISQLSISAGTLSPAFTPTGQSYSVTVANLSSISVTINSPANIIYGIGGPTVPKGVPYTINNLKAGFNDLDFEISTADHLGNTDVQIVVNNVITPIINYTSPQTYTAGAPITTLTPTITNVTTPPAYAAKTTISGFYNAGNGFTVDTSGNVYYFNAPAAQIVRIPASTTTYGTGLSDVVNMVTDAAGNIYAANFGSTSIQKITPAGVQTSIGSGLSSLYGVAVDAKGNVYASENGATFKGVIKIAPDGTQTILANGFGQAFSLAVDGPGNVYVADKTNNAVYIIPAGTTTTLAASSLATIGTSLSSPTGVTIDGSGNLYIANSGTNQIIEVSAAGVQTTFATGYATVSRVVAGSAGDIYFSDSGADVFADIKPAGGLFIYPQLPPGLTFDSSAGTISGTPTAGSLSTKYTVTGWNVDGASGKNNLVFNVTGNTATLQSLITSTGIIDQTFAPTTLAYTASVKFATYTFTPTAADVDATITVNGTTVTSGLAQTYTLTGGTNLYTIVVTAGNGTMQTYTLTVNYASDVSLASLSASPNPISPAFAGATTSYSESVLSSVTQVTSSLTITDPASTISYSINGGAATTPATITGTNQQTFPLQAGANTLNIIVGGADGVSTRTYTITINKAPAPAVSYAGPQVYSAGAVITPLTPTSSNVSALSYAALSTFFTSTGNRFPSAIASDANGNIFVGSAGVSELDEVSAAGTSYTAISTAFSNISAMTFDAAGNLYVSDSGNGTVTKITNPGQPGQTVNQIITGINFAGGIAVSPAGNIFVGAENDNTLQEYTVTGGVVSTTPIIVVPQIGLGGPTGLAFDKSGNLYMSWDGSTSIEELPASITSYPISSSQLAAIPTNFSSYIEDLIVDNAGNIFATGGSNVIDKIDPSHNITILSDTLGGRSLTIDPSGNLYCISGVYGVSIIKQTGGYYINPALPGGLSLNNSTGTISGTPTAGGPAVTYAVSGADGIGDATTATVSIQVAENNSSLSALSVSSGTLSPVFAPGTLTYSAQALNSIMVTPTTADPAATVTVGTLGAVASGTASGSITLTGNSTIIPVVVTSGDGSTTTTYTLTITPPPAPTISYSGPQTYTTGTVITPLAPTSTNVAGYGYSSTLTDMPNVDALVTVPLAVAVNAAGDLYVADDNSGTGGAFVEKIPVSGSPSKLAGSYSTPYEVALDAAGNYYVSDGSTGVTKNGAAIPGITDNAYSVAVDSTGNIFYAPTSGGVEELKPGTTTPAAYGSFDGPELATDRTGNLYGVEYSDNTLIKVAPNNGTITQLANGLATPNNVAVDGTGNIYIANNGSLQMLPADSSSLVDMLPGYGFGELMGVAVDGANNIYVCDDANNFTKKLLPVGGYFITPTLPPGLSFNNNTGIISGTPTVGNPARNYTITAYNGAGNFVSTIVNIKTVSNDATLSNIVLGNGTLSPAFATGTLSYTGMGGLTNFSITATVNDPTATITINGVAATSGVASAQTLTSGVNNFNITVTASDGTTTSTYTLAITKFPAATVSYTGPNVYPVNTAIAPLTPTSTNVATYSPQSTYYSGSNLQGMATDATGNLYVTQQSSVVEIPVNGGTPVTIATGLSFATSVAVDASGNIYVSDEAGDKVYSIINPGPSSTNHILISGLKSPVAVATDAAGNLYVLENNGGSSRDLKRYAITAGVAGTATTLVSSGFGTPQGLAVDATGNIYIADESKTTLLKIPVGTTFPTTVSKMTAVGSGFNIPNAVAVDNSGNLFVSDLDNQAVKEIAAGTGAITTVNGGTIQAVYGVAVDNIGNLYYSDNTANIVYLHQLQQSGGYTISPALPAGLSLNPVTGIISGTPTAGSPATNYTVTAYGPGGQGTATVSIQAVNATLSNLTISAGTLNPVFATTTNSYTVTVPSTVTSVNVTPTLADNTSTVNITSPSITTGNSSTNFPITAGSNPITITVTGADGLTQDIYTITVNTAVAPSISYTGPQVYNVGTAISTLSPTSSHVDAYAYSSTKTIIASSTATSTSPALSDPIGITTYNNNVYVVNFNGSSSSSIVQIPTGTFSSYGSGFVEPLNISSDNAGNLYVADVGTGSVQKINIATNTQTLVANGFGEPSDAITDAAGNIYVSDVSARTVTKISNGVKTTYAQGFSEPYALALDAAGDLYVADPSANAIYIIPANTTTDPAASTLTQVASTVNGTTLFDEATSIAFDGSGNLYCANQGNGTLTQLSNTGAATVLASGFSTIFSVTADGKGNVYATDYSARTANQISPVGGYFISPALPSGLTFNNSTGAISGTPLLGSPATNYTVTAYNAIGQNISTTLNIQIVSSNANLASLTLNTGTLSPAFTPTTLTGYTASVTATSISLTPTIADLTSTLTINGQPATSGSAFNLPLVVGNNPVTIAVTAGDGVTIQNYTLNITRTVGLTGIVLSAGTLSPSFNGNTTSYTASVELPSVGITATSPDPTYTLTINGASATSGVASTVPLTLGGNTVPVVVTSADGTSSQTYNLTITYTPSSNAGITNITLSSGSISRFRSTTTSYTGITATSNPDIVTVTTSDPTATVTVKNSATGVTVPAGSPVTLVTGSNANVLTIMATAGNGTPGSAYTLTITYTPSSTLSALSVNANPVTFPHSGTTLTASVTTRTITVTPTATDPAATITVAGTTVASGTASSPITLVSGLNAITVKVTPVSGSATSYTLNVTYTPSAIATLSNLAISAGTLSPTFSANTAGYSAAVGNTVSSINVTPTLTDPSATISSIINTTVSSTPVPLVSGVASVPLNVGSNTINILVTAANGTATKTYTLTVTRAVSTDATLSNLSIDANALSPSFDPGTTAYTSSVPAGRVRVSLTPVVNTTGATVTVNNVAATSGSPSAPVLLNGTGTTTEVDVTVTAPDGITTKTYVVEVTSPAATSADLTSISLNPYETLKTVSSTATETDYTTTVSPTISSVTVTPRASTLGQTITVDGNPVASETASQPITLNTDGTPTIITTVVTAQDGTTTKTLVISVSQAPLSVASLSSIKLTPSSTLATVSTSATETDYSTTAAIGTTSVTVTPKASGPGQTITVDGTSVATGTASAPITLNPDGTPTIITTVVTAPDGTTTNTYVVTVNQVPLNVASLTSIVLSPYSTLKVTSTSATETDYTTTAATGTTSVTVTPKASGAGQTITVDGNPVVSGNASGSITLNPDFSPTVITTVVTAPDGTTTNTYVITVNQVPLNVASLTSIVLSPHSTLKVTSTSATETDYTTTAAAGTTSVTVTPKASGAGQTITVDGNPVTSGTASGSITLNTDGTPTMITTVVTAPDGTTTNTYVIAVSLPLLNVASLTSIVLSPYSTLKATSTSATETSYTTTTPSGTTSVTVTPKASGSGQTITVNGNPVTSGTASNSITLNTDGSPTVITTVVTAPDGVTTNTYVVSVSQVPSNVASLSSIVLSPYSTLKTISATATETDYTTTTPAGTTSVTVTPKASGAGQTITVDGAPVVSGSASGSIALNSDGSPTIITTIVTAPDGTTTNTYVVTVNQVPSHVALLSSIVLTPHSTLKVITATATETDYTTTAAAGTTSVTVTPKTSTDGQSITVNGTPVASGTASGSITLNSDGSPTIITTVVTAVDGTTTNTYVITVNQVPIPPPLDAVNSIALGAPVSDVAVNDGIVVHQALSPNGDGINDVLTIDGLQKYSSNRLSIMNSNGVAVFSAQNYDNVNHVFDGHSNKGVMQAPGTYFYILQYKDGSSTKTKTGFIVLKY